MEQSEAERCIDNFEMASEVWIPRCYRARDGVVERQELHVFADGSSSSYGCAVYLRTVDINGQIEVALVCAKSRLCPTAVKLTIPRVELCAAMLAVRTAQEVGKEMLIEEKCITYWTDSVTVLRYIRNEDKRFHVFVANRVAEIRYLTNPAMQWMFVPSEENPADMSSRPLFLTGSEQDDRKLQFWFLGPAFLKQDRDQWPKQGFNEVGDLPEVDPEVHGLKRDRVAGANWLRVSVVGECSKDNNAAVYTMTSTTTTMVNKSGQCTEESVLKKLERVVVGAPTMHQMRSRVVYLKKFVDWMRDGQCSELTCTELDDAMVDIARLCQRLHLGEDYDALAAGRPLPRSSDLKKLNPVFDPRARVMRVSTRLTNSNVSEDFKCPMIVPKKTHFGDKMVREAHLEVAHMGVDAVMAKVRERWWLVGAKRAVKTILQECMACKRYHAKVGEQVMAALPMD